jgi:hypothetical protein
MINAEGQLTTLIVFLSNHFELIVFSLIAFSIFFGTIQGILVFGDAQAKKVIKNVVNEWFLMVLLVLQLAAIVSIYWINYKTPAPPLNEVKTILPDTQWVESDKRIFYVDRNELDSIMVDGSGMQTVFASPDIIREFQFSPDGQHMILATHRDLYLINLDSLQPKLIDTLGEEIEGSDLKGSISGIRWASDGQKFCYDVTRWSPYSSQENLYVYYLATGAKNSVRNLIKRTSSVYWDRASQNMYYFYYEAKDPSVHAYGYDIKVFKIALADLTSILVAQIPSEESRASIESLAARNIDLYVENEELSFDRFISKETWYSDQGSYVGIDQDDYFYFVPNQWFRKRLFYVPRKPKEGTDQYQYKGGDLVVEQIRWLPGGRYVVMKHKDLGILVLEPGLGKMGKLVESSESFFGWR